VVDPSLALKPRGQLTTEGHYEVSWSSFVIEPVKSRYSKVEGPSPSIWCRTVRSEIDGMLVTRLEALALTPDVLKTAPLPDRIARHASGAIALIPLRRIEIWGRDTGFPFADEYNNAASIPADRRIRFVGVSPSGNEGGFSLFIQNSGSGLKFHARTRYRTGLCAGRGARSLASDPAHEHSSDLDDNVLFSPHNDNELCEKWNRRV
jgi:hypothetical protein